MCPEVEVAPRTIELPLQIEVDDPVVANGNGFADIVTESNLLQPDAVTVSVK